MNAETQTVQDDLAFMRGLVEATAGGFPQTLGAVYLAGGLCYGFQVVAQVALGAALVATPAWLGLLIALGPTVAFAAIFAAILWRNRNAAPPSGLVARTIGVMFGSVGLANLAMIAVIGLVAYRHRSLEIWLIYPCVVFVLQGTAWLVAGAVRRRLWHTLVGVGWFVAAVAMGAAIPWQPIFALVAGIALIGLMAVPGWVMLRLARTGA